MDTKNQKLTKPKPEGCPNKDCVRESRDTCYNCGYYDYIPNQPKPDDDRLLTDEELGDLLDLYKEYTYPCSDGSKTSTIDCHEVVKAQRDLTASIKEAEARRAIETISACHEGKLGAAREECQAEIEELFKVIEDDFILGGFDSYRLKELKQKFGVT